MHKTGENVKTVNALKLEFTCFLQRFLFCLRLLKSWGQNQNQCILKLVKVDLQEERDGKSWILKCVVFLEKCKNAKKKRALFVKQIENVRSLCRWRPGVPGWRRDVSPGESTAANPENLNLCWFSLCSEAGSFWLWGFISVTSVPDAMVSNYKTIASLAPLLTFTPRHTHTTPHSPHNGLPSVHTLIVDKDVLMQKCGGLHFLADHIFSPRT